MKSHIITVKEFVTKGIELTDKSHEFEPDAFWESLKKTGTELWLDTGDMDQATEIWNSGFTALTTNNTLLNKEIQKGIYDDFIKEANLILQDLDIKRRVIEIAFILNARHALKLVEKFDTKVSVELHTDFARDIDASVEYGRRYHDISPHRFIIKVPYTAEGLIAAKKLREDGIPVNFTLGFSARQNALVAAFTQPAYLNVFLGRCGAYVSENGLGDGKYIGEKATLSTQRIINRLTENNEKTTKLIAASMRSGQQLADLAGVNVFTMPVKVAKEGKKSLKPPFKNRLNENYTVKLKKNVNEVDIRLNTLWDVPEKELKFALNLRNQPPKDAAELIERAREHRCYDMFPDLTEDDYQAIKEDGKIPKHSRWSDKIKHEEIAIDTLLNLAGLATFATDQEALDNRIKRIITSG
jgi:transaldolase